jgi:uncharacterized glyoxalase superfamily protein PhnB
MSTPEMQQARTVSSEVTVSADPDTAFTVFTDEMDLWWVRGPINFYDSARAIGMRCEHGVGGRLLELYASDGSDALVLGRITRWQPGKLLAWDSEVDDVTVEVRFESVPGGTKVVVTATIPAGSADKGGTAWVRVVPGWLVGWFQHRETAPRTPVDVNRLGLAIYYVKPEEAADWLADTFGFVPAGRYGGDEYEHRWIEFKIGNSSVMLFPLDGEPGEMPPVTHQPWVFVDDLDAHLAHARSRGATIISDISQHGYRAYEAADLEGRRWTFAQARPTM